MVYLFYILITILSFITVVFWVKNKKLAQELQEKEQDLNQSKELLFDTLSAEEIAYQHISEVLHSSISSKLYAIDLALYPFKKRFASTSALPVIQNISNTTKATLESIQHLANELSSPTLSELGLFPALKELANEYPIEIEINNTENHLSNKHSQQIYRIIKDLIHQSITTRRATQIYIKWKNTNQKWALIYSDNSECIGTFYKKNHIIATRLSLIKAHFQLIPTIKSTMQIHIAGEF